MKTISSTTTTAMNESNDDCLANFIRQCLAVPAFLLFPFACLNGILFLLFLLKSLFFKPNFVENRRYTISVTNNGQSFNCDNESLSPCTKNHESTILSRSNETDSSRSMSGMIRSQFQHIYNIRPVDMFECTIPGNEHVKFGELIGSGFVGVVYRFNSTANLNGGSHRMCAKLIDLNRLQDVIYEVNGTSRLSTDVSGSIAKHLESTTKRSILTNRFRHHFKQFALHSNRLMISSRPSSTSPDTEPQSLSEHWPSFKHSTTVQWGRQIGEALSYLHQEIGFAHFNLKPENVLLFETEGKGTKRELHHRYTAKIVDGACSWLVPTSSKVLSQGHDCSVYVMSSIWLDKFRENFNDNIQYDVYCYAMMLLLMLVGYENFGKRFILARFPIGSISFVRYRLMSTIESFDRNQIPSSFVELFQPIFSVGISKRLHTSSSSTNTISQMLKHEALSSNVS
ncbi:hypothetical protein RDWZM_005310 [Blomia tropicalis]|uniref:Protein kinase domain-containing protein n=1 Tax=Blomia tropicalis TaxID=40697 RepID=A0A9Q0M3R4_BLOTA|nr:hypothetical protein RDWZM_005310 [Blomia tropicalis]